MSNAKHTPGPWKLGKMGDGTSRRVEHRYGLIAVSEDESNARLIAAAPDLLAALEALLNYGNLGAYDRADAMKAARAAIAKARGTD